MGRQYKGNEDIETVVEREMSRLKIALEKRIVQQDVELEEKMVQSVTKGGKKGK